MALLQCEARGAFPKPQVQWQDGAGNVVTAEKPQVTFRGDRYYVTVTVTVTKTTTNSFCCVVTQQDINHKTQENVFVPFRGKSLFPQGWDFVLPFLPCRTARCIKLLCCVSEDRRWDWGSTFAGGWLAGVVTSLVLGLVWWCVTKHQKGVFKMKDCVSMNLSFNLSDIAFVIILQNDKIRRHIGFSSFTRPLQKTYGFVTHKLNKC